MFRIKKNTNKEQLQYNEKDFNVLKHFTDAKISTHANFMDPRYPQHSRQNLLNPLIPRQNLTRATRAI